jgi:hypothetical protein
MMSTRPTLCIVQLVVALATGVITKMQLIMAFKGGGGTTTTRHVDVKKQTVILSPPPFPTDSISQQHTTTFPLLKDQIHHRIGSPTTYALGNEHVVVMRNPIATTTVGENNVIGVYCEAILPPGLCGAEVWDKESIANDIQLVMQAIHAGSLSISLNNEGIQQSQQQQRQRQGAYYIPSSITLVKEDTTTIPTTISNKLMCCDDNSSAAVDYNDYLFNSEGVETNEILFDLSSGSNCLEVCESRMNSKNTARIFACCSNDGGGGLTNMAKATSDIYILLPTAKTVNDDFHNQVVVWKFGIEYNIATINIGSIPTLGSSSSRVYIPTIQRTNR